MTRCEARWREPGPCGTPLANGACPNRAEHVSARSTGLIEAVEGSIARHLDLARRAVHLLTVAELVDELEAMARDPRVRGPQFRRALVERAADMIREEWS